MDVLVMTFNIRNARARDGDNVWDARKELVFDLLREQAPDAVGLQEAFDFQMADIRAAMPEYGDIGVGRDDGKTRGEHNSILYRADRWRVEESGTFWFSDTPETPGSKHWGNAIPRICTWARLIERESQEAFYLYNLHLDHRSQACNEKGAALLARRLGNRNSEAPVVVTGDFNAAEHSPVILYLKGEAQLSEEGEAEHPNPFPMIDTFRALHPQAEEVGTWHAFEGKRGGAKIDYIFVSRGVQVLEAEIIRAHRNGRYPSDHFPVTARLLLQSDSA